MRDRTPPAYRPMGSPQRRPVYVERPLSLPRSQEVVKPAAPSRAVLHGTCAAAAVVAATMAVAPDVHAQATATFGFQGSATVVTAEGGTAGISRGLTDVITVNTAQTVIDWTPFNTTGTGTIDYLPDGRGALFQTNPSSLLTNFTVLNRIQPVDGTGLPVSRVLGFNGTVNSQINGVTGGSVWFYTPGGILVGATGRFNVGGLVLTSNPILTTGGLFGAGGEIRFRGAAGSTAAVELSPLAQINAPGNGSYVALVAPRVVQGGVVTVNGSTAYVGAEQADIRINNGLFDITITAGTGNANGVVHTGTTAGPASAPTSSTADAQRIYMVAVPKNNALTMLLSGNIGYTAAATAQQENSAVVLSAGFNVESGSAAFNRNATTASAASLNVSRGTYSSALTGNATSDIVITPTALLQFRSTTALTALDSITMRSNDFITIQALADLSLTAGNGVAGGNISVSALGGGFSTAPGRIDVTGQLTLNVVGEGYSALTGPVTNGLSATAGVIDVLANGGRITAGAMTGSATANASDGSASSGNAIGGSIGIGVTNNGQITFGSTTLDAQANVPTFPGNSPTTGGNAQGGSIRFTGNGGTLALGTVFNTANASAGSSSTGTAGTATGGNIAVDIRSGTHSWNSFYADVGTSSGYADNGGTFGAGTPSIGGINIDVAGPGSLAITSSVSLYADALISGAGASGGDVRGGNITITPRDGGTFTVATELFASANGQSFLSSFFGPLGAVSADTFGGIISLGAAGGTLRAGNLRLFAEASTSDATTTAGVATGGNVTMFASRSGLTRGNFTLTDCATATCSVSTSALGARAAQGSNGIGGNILLYSSDADVSALGVLSLTASGSGGVSRPVFGATGRSGDGQGGNITIESRAGALNNGTLALGDLTGAAAGRGTAFADTNEFNNGDGGTGIGGNAALSVLGGTFTANSIVLSGNGEGGASDAYCFACAGAPPTAFTSGSGFGGSSTFTMAGGTSTIGTLTIGADGFGGIANSGTGGSSLSAISGLGRGGFATFDAQAGTLNVDTINIASGGTGGNTSGGFNLPGANGGTGFGGTAQFLMGSGSTAAVTVTNLIVGATGAGGFGGSVERNEGSDSYTAGIGGDATGGTSGFDLFGGTLNATTVTLNSSSTGGAGGDNNSGTDGGNAGSGVGGTARLNFSSEGHTIDTLSVLASGQGGLAGEARTLIGFDINDEPIYDYGPGRGGNGGSGTGGSATMVLDVDPTVANLTVSAAGIGSAGGAGASGGDGGIGAGGTGGMGALLTLNFGTLSVTDTLTVTAAGTGGTGGIGYTDRGGRGGDGLGGEAGIAADGASTVLQTSTLLINADAQGGMGGASGVTSGIGIPGADGGNAIGGSAGLTASNFASVQLGDTTEITALARGGLGAIGTGGTAPGSGGPGGNGGDAFGGRATFAPEEATVTQSTDGTLLLSASADGGAGAVGLSNGGTGGSGGRATGGLAGLDGAGGMLTLTALRLDGSARGGAGASGDLGGAGGYGQAGTAALSWFDITRAGTNVTGTATFGSIDLDAFAGGGVGGAARAGLGGAGGEGLAGTASASINGIGSQVIIDGFGATASALGGTGGASSGSGTVGAAGGLATGGRALFEAVGGSQVTLPAALTIAAQATGGAGSNGAAGGTGGDGGRGGNAVGGEARFRIDGSQVRPGLSGGSYDLTTLTTGGIGGTGADGSGVGATGGIGGGGGDGTGGLSVFEANNADFALNDVLLQASGVAGDGGLGGIGPGTPGNPSAIPSVPPSGPIQSGQGFSGFATGGIARLLNSDTGALGVGAQRSLNNVTILANGEFQTANGFASGTAGGRIDILDTSTAAGGGLTVPFGTIDAQANGFNVCGCSGIFVSSIANSILTANAFLNTEAVLSFDFTGSGALRADGLLFGFGLDSLGVTHAGQPTPSVDSLFGNIVSLTSQGDVTASAGSILRAGNTLDVTSFGGSVDVARAFAVNDLTIQARSNVTVGDATVTGIAQAVAGQQAPVGGRIQLIAGSDFSNGFQPAQLNITGTVSATGSVQGRAGSDVFVASGAAIRSDNRISLEAGDDVFIHSGSTVTAALNPLTSTGFANPLDDPAALFLSAGFAIRDLANPGTASILVDGTVSAAGRPVILAGEAIQADAGPINSSSLFAYILRAPAAGVVSPADDLTLRADCTRGNICLGSLGAADIVRIGPLTGTADMANRVRIQGNIAARDVLIRVRDGIDFVGPTAVSGTDRLFLASLTGNLDLASGTTLTGGQNTLLYAGGSINGAGATVRASGTVGLRTGGNLTLANLTSGQLLQGVDADGVLGTTGGIVVPGAINISGRLDVGLGNGSLNAASIAIGTLAASDQALTATGGVTLGNALVTRVLNINADGAVTLSNGTIGNGTIGGDLRITTPAAIAMPGTVTAGSIALSGSAVTVGSATTTGNLGIAAASLTATTLNAGALLDIGVSGLASITTGRSANATIRAATLNFDALTATGAMLITAPNATGRLIDAGGGFNGTFATLADIGTINAAVIAITGGNLGTNALTSRSGDIVVNLATLRAGTATITSAGQFTATLSQSGAIGTAQSVGAMAISANSGLTVGALASTNGDVTLSTQSGVLTSGNLTAGRDIGLTGNAGSIVQTGTVQATRNVAISGQAVNIGAVNAGGTLTLTAASGNLSSGALAGSALTATASGRIDMTGASRIIGAASAAASGGIAISDLGAGGNVTLNGAQGITAGRLQAGGTTGLTANAGAIGVTNLVATGLVTATGRAVDLTSAGAVSAGQIAATAGNVQLRAGALNVTGVTASGDIVVNAALITSNSFNAGGTVTATTSSGALGIGAVAGGGTVNLTSATSMIVNSVTSATSDVLLTTLGGQVQISNSSAARDFIIDATGGAILQFGTVRAGRTINFAGDSVTAGTAIAGDDIILTGRNGRASLANGSTTGIGATNGSNILLTATTDAVAFNANAVDDLILSAGRATLISTTGIAGRDIRATGGSGDAFFNQLRAGRDINLAAGGGVLVQSATAQGSLQVLGRAGIVQGGTLTGGIISVNGDSGIDFNGITSGSTTSLTAANGPIRVGELASVGAVTANGRSIDLTSTGALTIATAGATAGNIVLKAGALAIDTATASGDITIDATSLTATTLDAGGVLLATSTGAGAFGSARGINAVTLTGASLNIGSVTSASNDIILTAQTGALRLGPASAGRDLTVNATAGAITQTGVAQAVRNIALGGQTISAADLRSGGALGLTSAGDLNASALQAGTNVTLQSGGGISMGAMSGGSLNATAATQIAINGTTRFTGAAMAQAGTTITIDDLSAGAIALNGAEGIAARALGSAGTTQLSAANGAVLVTELTSAGAVTASGTNIDLTSSGPLTITNATASAGNLAIRASAMTVGSATASNDVTLTATNGSLAIDSASAGQDFVGSATNGTLTLNNLSAGRDVTLRGLTTSISQGGTVGAVRNLTVESTNGLTANLLTSGGTMTLGAANGTIATNISAGGAVTAIGRAVSISTAAPTNFAQLSATAGNIDLQAPTAEITIGNANASGNITVNAARLTATTVGAGGALVLSGSNGLVADSVNATGTAQLEALQGAIVLSRFAAGGAVSATARGIDVTAFGPLNVALANATAGNLTLRSDNDLNVGTGMASGDATFAARNVSATSVSAGGIVALTGDSLDIGSANSGNGDIILTALTGPLRFGTVSAGRDLIATATAGALTQTGIAGAARDTQYNARTIVAADVRSGAAMRLTSNGDFSATTLQSGTGLALQSGGGIVVSGAVSGATLNANAATGIALGGATRFSGAAVAQAGTTIAVDDFNAGGDLTFTAPQGITARLLGVGGTSALTAANGAIRVTELASSGAVTATGRSIDLTAIGALNIENATATDGNIAARAAGLTFSNATASGNIVINASSLNAGTLQAGGVLTASAAGALAIDTARAGDIITLVGGPSLTAGMLTSTNGGIALTSGGNIAISGMMAGRSLTATAATGIALSGAGQFAGEVSLLAGGTIAFDTLSTSGNAVLNGDGGINARQFTVAGTTGLRADNGDVVIADILSTGRISATARSVDLSSTGAMTIDATGQSSIMLNASAINAGVLNSGGTLRAIATDDIVIGTAFTGGTSTITANRLDIGLFRGSVQSTLVGTQGITIQQLQTEAAALTATNGAVRVADVNAQGGLTILAQSIDLAPTTRIDLTTATATAGDIVVRSNTTQIPNGVIVVGNASATRDIIFDGASLSANTLTAGRNAMLGGSQALTVQSLQTGGTAALTATNGAVQINALAAAGAVTATGRAIDLSSAGALNIASATATAGNVALRSAAMTIASASASGDIGLTATTINAGTLDAGSVLTATAAGAATFTSARASGNVSIIAGANISIDSLVGNNISLSGTQGIAARRVQAGGTTGLSATNGAIVITDLASNGAVTASARAIDLTSLSALNVASATATAGTLALRSAAMSLSNAVASGDIILNSASLGGGTLDAGGALTATVTGAGEITSARGSTVMLNGGSLNIGGVTSTSGDIVLTSRAGALQFGTSAAGRDLIATATAGALAQTGIAQAVRDIRMDALAATVADLRAGGAISLSGSDGVIAGALRAGNDISVSSARAIAISGAITGRSLRAVAGTAFNLTGPAQFTGDAIAQAGGIDIDSLVAGGKLDLNGAQGITARRLQVAGGSALMAANGVVRVSDLTANGAVTTTGQSIDLASSGTLDIASATATAGAVTVRGGALSIGNMTASGNIGLTAATLSARTLTAGGALLVTSNGPATISAANAGGTISVTALAGITADSLISGGDVSLNGAQGINARRLQVSGKAGLTAANGVVKILDLVQGSTITATGQAIDLTSTGAMTIDNATATIGDIALRADALSLISATAKNDIVLNGASLTAGTLDAGGLLTATIAGSNVITTARGGGRVALTGGSLNLTSVTSGADDIILTAQSGALRFGNATASRDLIASAAMGAVDQTGDAQAGRNIQIIGSSAAIANLRAAGAIAVTGGTALTAGALQAGTDVTLSSGGTIAVTGAAAGRALNVSAGSLATLSGAIRFSGDVTIKSNGATIDSLTTGGNALLDGAQGITIRRLEVAGTTGLTASNGAIVVRDLAATGLVAGDAQSFDLTTSGALALGTVNGTLGLTLNAQSLQAGALGTTGALLMTVGGNANIGTLDVGGGSVLNAGGSLGITTLRAQESLINRNVNLATALSGAQGIDVGFFLNGGTTRLTATNGAIRVGSFLSTQDVTAQGQSITIGSTVGVSFANAVATTGDIVVNRNGSLFQTFALFGNANAARDIIVDGHTLTATTLIAGRNAVLNGSGSVAIQRLQTGGASQLSSNGAIRVSDLASTGAVTATGQSIDLTSVGPITIATATATGGNVALRSGAAVVTNANASGDVLLNVASLGAGSLNAGGALAVTATGATTIANAQAGGLVSISGSNVNVANATSTTSDVLLTTQGGALGLVNVQAGRDLIATAGTGAVTQTGLAQATRDMRLTGGSVNAAGLRAGGSITASAGSGVTIGAAQAATDITLASTGGAVTAANLTGRAITASAGGNVSLTGPVIATGALRITARGTASFAGQAIGQTIDVASNDIVIGNGARLGSQGTTTGIVLTGNDDQRRTFVGGGDQAGAYSLSADELTRLAATNVTVNAPRVSVIQSQSLGSTRAPDVVVRSFTMNAGTNGNLGTNGTFAINTPGKLRVEGDVRFTGLGAQGGFAINARDAIEVIAGSGSIDLRDGSNGLAGVLSFNTDDFIAATLAAISETASAATLDDRDRRLGLNDGVISEEGILRAGAIRVEVINGAYIQNTGASTSFPIRRGFTANSFAIDTQGSGTQIVLNGRLSDGLGGFITGLQTTPLVSINGILGGETGGYADRSTINGCVIASPGSCAVSSGFDARDSIDRVLDPTVSVSQLFPVTIVELRDFVAEGYPPLIDEPVTGAGNDDLWDRDCTIIGAEGCDAPAE